MSTHLIAGRATGFAVPLSALRTNRSAGIGEYLDLVEAGRFAKASGLRVIQLLPVNDTSFGASPYSAVSAFALHPAYLSVASLRETRGFEKKAEILSEKFKDLRKTDFQAVLGDKLLLLRDIWERDAVRIVSSPEYREWTRKNSWVSAYSVFMALREKNGLKHWEDWEYLRDPSPGDISDFIAENPLDTGFYTWLQMKCEEQFAEASSELLRMGIALKGDIPILMSDDSADVWSSRGIFNRTLAAGAPPDMFSRLGQNWGFPVYNWDAIRKSGYAFWKERLSYASKFYSAYRIDHVLGFFRIWALRANDESGYLGRYVPSVPLNASDLSHAGFSTERIRWLSEPHIPLSDIERMTESGGLTPDERETLLGEALKRIGAENLFLLSEKASCEKSIDLLSLGSRAKAYLKEKTRDRVLFEAERGSFYPTWSFREAGAWASLSESEKTSLEKAIERKAVLSNELWERNGHAVLAEITRGAGMLACAEDLGAVPECVPSVLSELGILSLRVVRWTRDWGKPADPFVAFGDYPEASVATTSVHDSTTLRDWWETDPQSEDFKSFLEDEGLFQNAHKSRRFDQSAAEKVLSAVAQARSRLFIPPIQDLLALSDSYAPGDPSEERINVPGTVSGSNWTYVVPAEIEKLPRDGFLTTSIARIAHIHDTI